MKRFETMPDERVIIDEGIHWKNMLSSVALAVLCVGAAALRLRFRGFHILPDSETTHALADTLSTFLTLILTLLLLFAVIRIIRTSCIRYYVTDRRIIRTSGIINVSITEMMLSRVEMVILNQNPYERLFNCGDIRCVSAGAELFLDDVRNAREVKAKILELMPERR